MTLNKHIWILLAAFTFTASGCKKGEKFNLFGIEDDKQLGFQTSQEINGSGQFLIIPEAQYPQAYAYINKLRDDIIASGKVKYATEFPWEIKLVKDDATVNAFCLPGGYIYVYTGLIRYLDNSSALAGVMGHEMAHADRRHSTSQMTKIFGIQTLLDVALGRNQGMVSQVAQQLIALKFSRNDETDADTHSVIYLCPTKYRADGAADFFIKIQQSGAQTPPEFLSTHPNPDNRVQNIQAKKNEFSCVSSITTTQELNEYQAFKNSLP